ncbi:MAG TPA: arsenate reductase (glutaredoxin), partial [Candidatus Marinimicrobia bacterium]|nr:arsenate reductase (glutaredoxin) [Candidatus Neomarinimicrobiota bacterium]
QLLRDNGIEPFIIEYLKNNPTIDEFRALSVKLGMRPMEFVRKAETDFKNNNLKNKLEDDKAMFKAMNKYPKIMERPIVVKGDRAVLGRPPENIIKLL